MAKYLIAWSGGLDSTYLILKLLEQGHSVDAVYIKLINNEYKVKCELEAIDKMVTILTELCLSRKWRFNYKGVATEIHILRDCNLSFKQYPMWLLGLVSAVEDDTDFVAIGYVMNDDAISYLEDFKNIWNSYKVIVKKHVELVFPLSKSRKSEFYYEVPDQIRRLLWVCEQPINDKPCGCCDPCKRAIREYKPDNIRPGDLVKTPHSYESVSYDDDYQI